MMKLRVYCYRMAGIAPVVETMAGVINYLTVSLYQGRFTYNHEQSWARLNEMYDRISKTPTVAPPVSDIQEFYNHVIFLWRVTDTDDQDYHIYTRNLRRYIACGGMDEAVEAARLKEEHEQMAEEYARQQHERDLSEREDEWWDETDAKEREDWYQVQQ